MKHAFLKFLGVVVVAATITCLSSCNNEPAKSGTSTTEPAAFNVDNAKSAITESNKAFSASFATGDSTAFANCYASDACIYVEGMPKMCGTASLTTFFNEGYKQGIRNVALTTDEVMGGQEGVIETGRYEMFMANNVSADKGKYMVMWKEENGKWKMFRDIWNTDIPPTTK